MPAIPEERSRVLAVVRALKAIGVRVRNWKSFLHGEKTPEQETPQQHFAFGRDLQLLPQCHVAEVDGSVPLFLVEACEFLSQHIHTEGIFRKTGSLGRIRALRSELEKGNRVFLPPHDALLQPCDVASVLKQFLRELPDPLIAGELQVALCHAQTLEGGSSERATLLLTSLLPPIHTRTLRYICSFLRRVAHRCDENRMEVSSLALVMAPNLLPCSPQSCRLTLLTEKQLEQQAAAIRTLIIHAERIGVVPLFILDRPGATEASDSTPPLEGALLNKRARLGVYSSLCRQRRRSVGEIFVDAFSKLKPSRTHTGPSLSLDAPSGPSLSPTPQSPNTVKRKASEDGAPEASGSARKRRSLHDLRADVQSVSSQSTDDWTEGPSPEVKSSDESQHSVSETMAKIRAQRKSHRAPKQEDRARRRRRSLRFFSMSSNSDSPIPSVTPCRDPETFSSPCKKLHSSKNTLSTSDSDSSLKIPLILIEEPGRVVIGSEVDDDPELLNCSFLENPNDGSGSESEETLRGHQQQDSEHVHDDDRWVLLDDRNPEVIVEYDMTQSQRQEVRSPKTGGGVKIEEQESETHNKPKKRKSSSQKRSGPRRSISMPEVALEPCSDEVDQVQQEVSTNEAVFNDEMWSTSVSLPLKKSGGKGKEGREVRRRRYGTFHERKKEKVPDSDLKKANLRLSMAERFRSFSALASFLRTPTVRLRRQGARRFSRSFSDEAVQEDQQAFLELNDELTDSEEPNEELLPEHSPSTTSPSEDQTLIGSSQKSEEDENLQINECMLPQTQKVEEFDLDKMFEQQCQVTEEYGKHSDSCWDVQFDGSTPSSQRRASFSSPADSCAFTASETEPLSPQCETSPCKTFSCLSFDGVFSISSVSEKCSISLDLSPPNFQFMPQGSRRRYRDSPRWPSNEVRMTTWKPLPF
ncbi:hypothetical protein KOW79_014085 [Hemibagrus wyckioides]|uniref:Rho-GAP domain-containing protein n=1 Tax=Hemibagrus wyckioides TaxID=337641 RepID=A0A9D3NJ58_9TELE|nr:uncharacterized protein zgc:153345 [Hemibagrus wyckioides]KAG7322739.1 hypothetical protein KOW79_014085 [Hemibagrus wyckioides]